MKLAYNGKIKNHGAKHRVQAIALLAAMKTKIRQYINDGLQVAHHVLPSWHHAWVG